jgi:hypothetical protein
MICIPRQIFQGNEIKVDEMYGARGMQGRKRDMRPRFWWRNLKEEDRLLYMCSLEDVIKMYVKDTK